MRAEDLDIQTFNGIYDYVDLSYRIFFAPQIMLLLLSFCFIPFFALFVLCIRAKTFLHSFAILLPGFYENKERLMNAFSAREL